MPRRSAFAIGFLCSFLFLFPITAWLLSHDRTTTRNVVYGFRIGGENPGVERVVRRGQESAFDFTMVCTEETTRARSWFGFERVESTWSFSLVQTPRTDGTEYTHVQRLFFTSERLRNAGVQRVTGRGTPSTTFHASTTVVRPAGLIIAMGVFAIGGILIGLSLPPIARRASLLWAPRTATARCECGYDVSGLVDPTCPECGRPLPWREPGPSLFDD